MKLIKEGKNYSIASESKDSQIPRNFSALRFNKIISVILGKRKSVSIAFVRQAKMRFLNNKFRKKKTSTDVLSFKLGNTGEIIFSIDDILKKAKIFKLEAPSYLSYLFIHALLHLKGFSHSSKMDRQEKNYCKVFGIKYPFN